MKNQEILDFLVNLSIPNNQMNPNSNSNIGRIVGGRSGPGSLESAAWRQACKVSLGELGRGETRAAATFAGQRHTGGGGPGQGRSGWLENLHTKEQSSLLGQG